MVGLYSIISFVVVGYYDYFPPKSKNVSVVPLASTTMTGVHQVLIVNKDFAAGETIYNVGGQFIISLSAHMNFATGIPHCHCFGL